ncbi:MAG TPA: hypothetical protein VNA69_11030 [Thermoanaerobaculia bacterium]|nr:hypothetical protein [Thermoanaerobaculia bacterium]
MASLLHRYTNKIVGVLSCLDRVVIQGTIPSLCHAGAVATLLDARDIRIFDYGPLFADPFRQSIRSHVDRLAANEGVEVEYIKKPKGIERKTASGRSSPSEAITRGAWQEPPATSHPSRAFAPRLNISPITFVGLGMTTCE